MRRTLLILTLLAGLAVTAGATEQVIPASEFDLADHAGKVVVVDFWASWCPPCREAMPFLSAMQAKYGDQGLVTLAVTVDQDPKAADKMIGELHDGIIAVRDHEGVLAQKHGIRGLPTALVIGRDGEIASTHVGFHAGEKATREEELKKLLAEPVS
jgi:thiol-disulfide isomerase/thioredoxin